MGFDQADITFIQEVEVRRRDSSRSTTRDFPSVLDRSAARSTDAQLLPLFGKPGLVYSGANSSVQRKIDNSSIVAIPRSTRDSRRVAPHNVFVNLDKIAKSAKLAKAKSIGWTFNDAAPRGATAKAVKVRKHDTFDFRYSSGRYTVRWNGPVRRADSGVITKADNVVIMKVHNHPDGNRDVQGAPSVQSDTVGTGAVGRSTGLDGRSRPLERAKAAAPFVSVDKSGNDHLKPGQTQLRWLDSVVAQDTTVDAV